MRGLVLVADDAEDMRVLLEVVLSRADFDVAGPAVDGLEAVRLWEERQDALHAVVLDERMPGASGTEVAARILADRPGQRVLLVSAQVDDELRERARALGVAAVLGKDEVMALGEHPALR